MTPFVVYVSMCVPNGKLYFGITSKRLSHRILDHLWSSRSRAKYRFHKAIGKHGSDNFVWYEIGRVSSWTDACEFERALIQYFSTRDPQRGYNDTDGGEGTYGRKHSEETKRRIGAANASRPGHKHSEETRAKMKVSQRLRRKTPVTEDTRLRMREAQIGKRHSEATKLKLSAHMNGGSPILVPMDKVIPLLDAGRTIRDISRELELSYHVLYRRIRDYRKDGDSHAQVRI